MPSPNSKGFFVRADAGRLPFADDSVDLVFTSPPYLDRRTYEGSTPPRDCSQWIDWMLGVVAECVRVSRGLVLINCDGSTRRWNYRPAPEGLLYEWWRRGGRCWRPAYWVRDGIPGSGGKQGLKSRVEHVLAFTSCERQLPWADNIANGHLPRYGVGGNIRNRKKDGARVGLPNSGRDDFGINRGGNGGRLPDGKIKKMAGHRAPRGSVNGDMQSANLYKPPKIANPGNVVAIKTGGGMMGHELASRNEAPFPVDLPAWFIRTYCPPGGITLDPFVGSGTTVQAAIQEGRIGIGCDIRPSQLAICTERCQSLQPTLF